jgi:hypothetical protein
MNGERFRLESIEMVEMGAQLSLEPLLPRRSKMSKSLLKETLVGIWHTAYSIQLVAGPILATWMDYFY